MERRYTRTILFSEQFDFPTPPTWNRQSLMRVGSPAGSTSTASSEASSPVSEAADVTVGSSSPQTPITTYGEESEPCSPMTLSSTRRPTPPPRPPRSPSTFYSFLEEPLPGFMEFWNDQQQYFPVQQTTWEHANGAVPDCPCCASASMSRWSVSVCSEDERPPSPTQAIHQRLRKMASSSTLRSVRTSLRSRIKTSIMQLTRRSSV